MGQASDRHARETDQDRLRLDVHLSRASRVAWWRGRLGERRVLVACVAAAPAPQGPGSVAVASEQIAGLLPLLRVDSSGAVGGIPRQVRLVYPAPATPSLGRLLAGGRPRGGSVPGAPAPSADPSVPLVDVSALAGLAVLLAGLHARGRVHAVLDAWCVFPDGNGGLQLAGQGIAEVLGLRAAAATDVRALAALGTQLLGAGLVTWNGRVTDRPATRLTDIFRDTAENAPVAAVLAARLAALQAPGARPATGPTAAAPAGSLPDRAPECGASGVRGVGRSGPGRPADPEPGGAHRAGQRRRRGRGRAPGGAHRLARRSPPRAQPRGGGRRAAGPVRLPGSRGAAGARSGVALSRLAGLPALAALVGGALLAASLAWSAGNPAPAGRAWRAPGEGSRVGAGTAERPSTWWAVLTRLDTRRSAIFAAPRTAAGMGEVDYPGSPAEQADAALVHLLRSRGAHVIGLDLRLRSVAVRSRGTGPPGIDPPGSGSTPESSGPLVARPRAPGAGGWVVLAVSDTLPPYEIVSASGAVLARKPGRGPHSWLITLRWDTGRGWLIDSVAAASPD